MDWNGKTKQDQEKQCTGFSIDAGEVGYLRASIGMTRENAFLRALFPEKHWENGTGKPMRYKFMEGDYETLIKAGVAYLMTVLTGKEIETGIDRKRELEK